MNYDVIIGGNILHGISYSELSSLPIHPDTLVRRNNSNWMHADECMELNSVLSRQASYSSTHYSSSVSTADDLSHNYRVHSDGEDVMNNRNVSFNIDYIKYKQKRKAAIIGVCTLGLAGLSLMGITNIWNNNIFAGTSFSSNAGIAFVLKCLSFCLLTAILAIPYFIYSIFALIYYSIKLSN